MKPQQISHRQLVGLHEVTIEGKDVVHVRCHGEMTAEHVLLITSIAEAHLEQLEGSFMLVDLRHAAGMPSAARRRVVDWLRQHRLAATVNYGASVLSRTFSNLVIRALRTLHDQVVENVFVDTELAARAWVERHRAQVRAEVT